MWDMLDVLMSQNNELHKLLRRHVEELVAALRRRNAEETRVVMDGGRKIEQLQIRLQKIAEIIRRLLAVDGPCGDQPPQITLDEWRQMYLLATGDEASAAGGGE
jgi:hypothetical protein